MRDNEHAPNENTASEATINPWLAGVGQDLRYGLRRLRNSPGFALVALLTLALGIGANLAIFQLIDAVRLQALPVKDPNRLAIVHLKRNHWGSGNFNGAYSEFTYPLWRQIRKRQKAFASVAAWGEERLNLARGGEVKNANAIWVSGEFFHALGLRPFLGRLLAPADDRTGCAGGVDLSYGFWQRHYGADGGVLGKTLTIAGHAFPILGVTPPGFTGVSVGENFDLAVPVCAEPILDKEYSRITSSNARRDWWLAVLGRLKPGWTRARASAQLEAIAPAALRATIPPQYDANGVKHYLAYRLEARPGGTGFSYLRQYASSSLWLLLGLSGLVLLLACANLANLMLVRTSAREREIAVRLAMGASRGRLLRQMLVESALLALGGAACGGLLAAALSHALLAFINTPNLPIFLKLPTDWRMLGFAAGLAAATTLLFGGLPAWRAGRVAPGTALKTGGRGTIAGRFRMQRSLITAQIALSLVLLAGALLFARSLTNLMTRRLGFQQNGILIANLDYFRLNLPAARRNALVDELLEQVRATPGVEAAAASIRSPLSGSSSNDGILGNKGLVRGSAWLDYISPGYFRTMQIPLIAGRDFNAGDNLESAKVAIVNPIFIQKFLGGTKYAIGKQFRIWQPPGKPEPAYRIVGVMQNSVYENLHKRFTPMMYFPRAQWKKPWPGATLLIRAPEGMAELNHAVLRVINDVSPEIAVQFRSLHRQILDRLAKDELMATLCGFYGGLAMLLAAIGLYGVISYTVMQRTNEIGVRMALGAQRGGIARMILGEVAMLLGIGIVIGEGLALAGGSAASALLYGLKPRDPLTLALAAGLLAAIGLGASLAPARRASRLDPMTALRYE